MSSANIVPIPLQDAIASPTRPEFSKSGKKDPREGMITQPWVDYFTSQGDIIGDNPTKISSVTLTTQGASIGATDFSGGTLSSALYRITYYARITTADDVASSLIVTFDWTDGGATPSFSGAAMVANTVTTYQSGTLMIHIDTASPIRYSTTYVGTGPVFMKYSIFVVLESVPS